jgi:hypothetical protein
MRRKVWSENLKRRHHFEDKGIDVSVKLMWILKKRCELDSSGFG